MRAEHCAALRISLVALAQAAKAVLTKDADFTPPLPAVLCESFGAHLVTTAPQAWREVVLAP